MDSLHCLGFSYIMGGAFFLTWIFTLENTFIFLSLMCAIMGCVLYFIFRSVDQSTRREQDLI